MCTAEEIKKLLEAVAAGNWTGASAELEMLKKIAEKSGLPILLSEQKPESNLLLRKDWTRAIQLREVNKLRQLCTYVQNKTEKCTWLDAAEMSLEKWKANKHCSGNWILGHSGDTCPLCAKAFLVNGSFLKNSCATCPLPRCDCDNVDVKAPSPWRIAVWGLNAQPLIKALEKVIADMKENTDG